MEKIHCRAYRLARQRHQAGKDVKQVRMMKDKDGNTMTDEESVLRIWKEYYKTLISETMREGEREGEREGGRDRERVRESV